MGDKELVINDFSKAKRYLPYFEQAEGTDEKPTLYGVHLSKKDQVQFTFRFSNGCYLMVISWRKGGTLPLNDAGSIYLRCKKKSCKAKALVKYKFDDRHLENWNENFQSLRNTKNWEVAEKYCGIAHNCDMTVKFCHSDTENFADDYIGLRLNLVSCETAWGEAQKSWETGLGAELDGIIYGVKVINKIFLFF